MGSCGSQPTPLLDKNALLCLCGLFSHRASCCCCQVASVVSDSVRPHRWQPTRLCHPWDSPGKNTGVGCYFLLQCMQVKSESEVAQFCPTLRDPMDCSPPGSSVHGIFQARVLEWGAIAFSTHRARAPFKIFTIFLSVLIVDFPLSFKYCILSLLIWGKNNNILILSMSLHLHLLLPHNW